MKSEGGEYGWDQLIGRFIITVELNRMYHWDMIALLLFLTAWTVISLALAIRRWRWFAIKLLVPAIVLGVATELGAHFLQIGGGQSPLWKVWLFIHLPASLALDPLPLRTAQILTVVIYSFIAAGVWHLALRRFLIARKQGAV